MAKRSPSDKSARDPFSIVAREENVRKQLINVTDLLFTATALITLAGTGGGGVMQPPHEFFLKCPPKRSADRAEILHS